jgi:hypothetical protein
MRGEEGVQLVAIEGMKVVAVLRKLRTLVDVKHPCLLVMYLLHRKKNPVPSWICLGCLAFVSVVECVYMKFRSAIEC